jgi:hypothetical protein
LLSPAFYFLFIAHQILHWPSSITIACHCSLISIPAFFGSGNVAPASIRNNNMDKGRWTCDKHKIFMQQYEKHANSCMQIAKVLSTQTPAQMKTHAECFFKETSKTNSEAVKRYCKSLSPNGKARVLVKNAAEQQKH